MPMQFKRVDVIVGKIKESGGWKNWYDSQKQKWSASEKQKDGTPNDWFVTITEGANLDVQFFTKDGTYGPTNYVVKVMAVKNMPMAGKSIAGMPQMEEQMQELPAVPPAVKKDYPPLPTKPVPQVDIHKAQALLDTPIPDHGRTNEYWDSQNARKQMASAYSSACSLLSRVMQPNTLPGDITMDTLLDRVKQAAEYIYTRISEAGEEQPPEGEGE